MVLKNKHFEPSSDYLRMKTPIESQTFRKIAEELRTLTGYENDEVILLTHNYCTVLWENIKTTDDWKSLVGLPLEYYGKMNLPYSVNWSGYLSGYGDGSVSTYASSYENFQENSIDPTKTWDTFNFLFTVIFCVVSGFTFYYYKNKL